MEELNIRILDQFVREEGSEEENKAWDDIRAKANGAKPTLCEVRAALATIYDIKGIVLQSKVQAEYYGEDGFVYSKIVRLIEKYEREHFA